MTETTLKADKSKSSSLASLVMPLVYALVVIAVFTSLAFRLQSSERELCSGVVFRAAAELEDYMAELQDEASRMASSISRNPDLPKPEAARIASALLSSRTYVTGVSLAPSALVRYHFPETGGESLLGHDLLSNPERREALTQAMELNAPVFSGPFESLEGGSVLFIRYPVFSAGKFWGFVSITLDFDGLVKALSLDASYPGFIFALSSVDRPESMGQGGSVKTGGDVEGLPSLMIAGDADAFKLGVSSSLLNLQGLSWRLHTMPAKGWLALSPALYLLGVAALAGAFFLFAWIKALSKKRADESKDVEFLLSSPVENEKKPTTPFPEVIDGPMIHRSREKSMRTPAEPKPAIKGVDEPGMESAVSASDRAMPEFPLDDGSATPSDAVTIQFKGPSVKGQLYMPDVMFSGNPKDLFAHLRVVEDEAKTGPGALPESELLSESEPAFMAEPASVPAPGSDSWTESKSEPEPLQARRVQPALDSVRNKAAAYRAAVNLRSVSILVVDDSEANRDIMGRMLTLRGYEPEFAASGEEALARCLVKEYDTIFMDCFMPGMDGYKTCELIRSSRVSSRTKIVGMSARVGDKELERCKASGMNDLLSKPFTLSQLTAMIQGLTERG